MPGMNPPSASTSFDQLSISLSKSPVSVWSVSSPSISKKPVAPAGYLRAFARAPATLPSKASAYVTSKSPSPAFKMPFAISGVTDPRYCTHPSIPSSFKRKAMGAVTRVTESVKRAPTGIGRQIMRTSIVDGEPSARILRPSRLHRRREHEPQARARGVQGRRLRGRGAIGDEIAVPIDDERRPCGENAERIADRDLVSVRRQRIEVDAHRRRPCRSSRRNDEDVAPEAGRANAWHDEVAPRDAGPVWELVDLRRIALHAIGRRHG